jgi:hypothetical protein
MVPLVAAAELEEEEAGGAMAWPTSDADPVSSVETGARTGGGAAGELERNPPAQPLCEEALAMLTATERGAASARNLLELALEPSCFVEREESASEPRLFVTLLLVELPLPPPLLLMSLASCTSAAAVLAGGETRFWT